LASHAAFLRDAMYRKNKLKDDKIMEVTTPIQDKMTMIKSQ